MSTNGYERPEINYCSSCGSKIFDQVNYCNHCGAKLFSENNDKASSNIGESSKQTTHHSDNSQSRLDYTKQQYHNDSADRLTNFIGFGLAWWFIVGPEIFFIAVIVGFSTKSWLWFAVTILATWFLMVFKWTARLLVLGFALFWSFAAGSFVYQFNGGKAIPSEFLASINQLSGPIAVGFVFFILSFGIHWYAFRGHQSG